MSSLSKNKYNTGVNGNNYSFASYPSVKIYKESAGSKWGNHLLFGDYIKILDTEIINGRVSAKSRNTKGWVKVSDLQKNRILEVNFVDIGQGDGCHMVTPEDEHFIIDAGKHDNMNRYLTWRFNLYNKKKPISIPFKVIISHSDSDHYGGFEEIFENDKLLIDKIYHNGLVERPGDKPLGETEDGHFIELVKNTSDMKNIINNPDNRSGSHSMYPKVLHKVLENNPGVTFQSLSHEDDYLENKDNWKIKILGPILSETNNKDSLKSINNLGKDKNGHSVILKVLYDKVKILLGGDVNEEFGEIICDFYKDRIGELQVDIAKACHHGSNHFHYEFIESINAAGTIISSGDNESYSHPRPDTLGALGKCGFGRKPLIFSTELARSNKEITFLKLSSIAGWIHLLKEIELTLKNEVDAEIIKELEKKKTSTNKKINSFLTKFGMINLRTDGEKMIIAQKLETPSASSKWDIHQLEYSNDEGRFTLM